MITSMHGKACYEKGPYDDLNIECDVYKKLMRILKNNYKIPAELLDEQRKLILKESMLKEFIAMLASIPTENVIIDTHESDSGCCGISMKMIGDIEDIKIKVSERCYKSLKIFYNEIYNRIIEEFGISLKKINNNIM